jgi:hypothetical protein
VEVFDPASTRVSLALAKHLINTRQPISSVRERNKITIKDVIEICAKHARVKNVKKRKYELDARNSVKNQSKNPKGCRANLCQ